MIIYPYYKLINDVKYQVYLLPKTLGKVYLYHPNHIICKRP